MNIDDATREALIADGWKAPIDYKNYREALAAYNQARGYENIANDIRSRETFTRDEKSEIDGLVAAFAAMQATQ